MRAAAAALCGALAASIVSVASAAQVLGVIVHPDRAERRVADDISQSCLERRRHWRGGYHCVSGRLHSR